jgi:hypothetical protein
MKFVAYKNNTFTKLKQPNILNFSKTIHLSQHQFY